jgi:hypothetical protein
LKLLRLVILGFLLLMRHQTDACRGMDA